MNSNIPHYINEKGNVIRLVLGTSVFALLFINIFQPFDSRHWADKISGEVSDWVYLLFSSLIILTAMCVMTVSRMVMYHYAKKREISIISYIFWVLGEIIAMALFYTLFPKLVWPDQTPAFDILFKKALESTSLIILLPYAILWLYFSWRDKELTLQKIVEQKGTPKDSPQNNLLCFYDEKGDLRLSLNSDSLYYIESADNYVNIHYLNKGKINNFMLRNSLKNIDELFGTKNLLRCHRSYIVNFDKVKILRKSDDGLRLDFDNENIPNIPVSRTYSDRVMERFTSVSKV